MSPTVHQVWRDGVARLTRAEVATTTPELDARVLVCHALKTDLTGLVSRYRDPFPPELRPLVDQLLERRAGGEPVAWVVGVQEFRGLEFAVGEGVLVPRADTETLVEAALDVTRNGSGPLRVVDVCTGSACVAVSLAHELPREREVVVHAVELSPQALAWARRNAGLVAPPRSVQVHHGNLLRGLPGTWDLIVSNPPYLTPEETRERVGPGGWKEPSMALDGGGSDGLALIRQLIAQAELVLNSDGWLLLEAADAQMDALAACLSGRKWSAPRLWRDLAGQRRVIGACRVPDSRPAGR